MKRRIIIKVKRAEPAARKKSSDTALVSKKSLPFAEKRVHIFEKETRVEFSEGRN